MSKTLPHKTILIFGIIFCFAILIIAANIGCSTQQKKRGIVFRGDWAFEINRTPWVGHPGTTDIPGSENEENKENKKGFSLCTKDKKPSLSDSLLGPLTALKSKCRCKDCLAASGAGGANINYTSYSYHPSIANTFPNPMPGAYPGTIPQGSLSLPPGAIVVPSGVLMPNGTLLPHHLFYSQPNATSGLQTSDFRLQDGTAGGINGNPDPRNLKPEAYSSDGIPVQPPQPPQPQPPSPQMMSPQMQSPQIQAPAADGITVSQIPALQRQFGGMPQQVMQQQVMSPQGMPQIATSEMQTAIEPNATAQNAMAQNAMMQNVLAQNTLAQNSLMQSLNPANPMLVNPAYAQVVPGMSMTGTQAPGYPPIGYAPSGYSPGYTQQVGAPPITGPMGAQPMSQSSLAAGAGGEGREASDRVSDEELAARNAGYPSQVAQMPYPRHFPVPTQPVYQRNMGMAPGYAAVQPPRTSPVMSPQQQQIAQAAAMQEQQMLLERQRQALIMQQQNSHVTQTASRQPTKPATLRQPPIVEKDDADNIAPLPPTSSIILANHQTSILQPPSPRVSQVALTAPPPPTKKTR